MIAAAAALTVSGAAVAGPSYSFIDGAYLVGDSGDDRTNGFATDSVRIRRSRDVYQRRHDVHEVGRGFVHDDE